MFRDDSKTYRRLLTSISLTGFLSGIELFILGFFVIFVCTILITVTYWISSRHWLTKNILYTVKYTILFYLLLIAYIPVYSHTIQYMPNNFEGYEIYIMGLMVFILVFFPFFLAVWTFVNSDRLALPSKLNKFGVLYESLRYP